MLCPIMHPTWAGKAALLQLCTCKLIRAVYVTEKKHTPPECDTGWRRRTYRMLWV